MVTVVSEFNYDAIINSVSNTYPYQTYVGRAPLGSLKCVGFMIDGVFFSCELTMAVATKGALDKFTLDMLLVDDA